MKRYGSPSQPVVQRAPRRYDCYGCGRRLNLKAPPPKGLRHLCLDCFRDSVVAFVERQGCRS